MLLVALYPARITEPRFVWALPSRAIPSWAAVRATPRSASSLPGHSAWRIETPMSPYAGGGRRAGLWGPQCHFRIRPERPDLDRLLVGPRPARPRGCVGCDTSSRNITSISSGVHGTCSVSSAVGPCPHVSETDPTVPRLVGGRTTAPPLASQGVAEPFSTRRSPRTKQAMLTCACRHCELGAGWAAQPAAAVVAPSRVAVPAAGQRPSHLTNPCTLSL